LIDEKLEKQAAKDAQDLEINKVKIEEENRLRAE